MQHLERAALNLEIQVLMQKGCKLRRVAKYNSADFAFGDIRIQFLNLHDQGAILLFSGK